MPRRSTKTVKMTREDLVSMIMDCEGKDQTQIQKYISQVFKEQDEKKKLSKSATSVYSLFCYEQRPIIMRRLVDTGEWYFHDKLRSFKVFNQEFFGEISKELSKAWKEAKNNPQYAKGTEWYNQTLATKTKWPLPDLPDLRELVKPPLGWKYKE